MVHDVGYAPDLVVAGMHQLDGARYLRDVAKADALICQLVALQLAEILSRYGDGDLVAESIRGRVR